MNCLCKIAEHSVLFGPYRRIRFDAPEIVAKAVPGQFVHVRILALRDRILRRPFSICSVDEQKGLLTVVYKIVGQGTDVLSTLVSGDECEILGPQGNGYNLPKQNDNIYPILVGGGYGAASTLFLAERLAKMNCPGTFLEGARTKDDLILLQEYENAGFSVDVATNDGTAGIKGFVTELLDKALATAKELGKSPKIFACGPGPMLQALGKIALAKDIDCELSLDQRMGCGIGACFACVIKVNDATNTDGWRYSRSCKEGPVYNAKEVYFG